MTTAFLIWKYWCFGNSRGIRDFHFPIALVAVRQMAEEIDFHNGITE